MVQLIGWTTFELVTISTAMQQITSGIPRWAFVVAGGLITTLLALRPLGWIRVLRRYVTVLVVIALCYLGVQLLRNPLPALGHGSWNGFWIAVDTVIGAAASYVPMAADYSRHSTTVRKGVLGTFVGYSITQIACYGLGLVALLTVAHGNADKIFGAFMAVPVGTLAFAVLATRELDQSFVDTYSAAISVQNIRPRWDRRLLALAVGTVSTVFALGLNIYDYENFLILLGAVFVPLAGVLAVDYFVVSQRQWDLSESAPLRWLMLVPWLVGFVIYQLVNPGYVDWWARAWSRVDSWLGFTPASWMSASILSFAVAAVVTLPIGRAREEVGRACRCIRRSLTRSRPAHRSWRWRARSSATACPAPTTCASPARSRATVRAGGAVPATIAVVDGQARIGLDDDALARVASDPSVVKVSVRDLASVAARGGVGATTVASTAHLAARAGIAVFATGGLGGVHRGAVDTWDESADLTTLSRTPVLVVCAGVKSILDVARDPRATRDAQHRRARLPHRPVPRLLPARLGPPARLARRLPRRGRGGAAGAARARHRQLRARAREPRRSRRRARPRAARRRARARARGGRAPAACAART